MSLLTIVQDVCRRLTLPVPASAYSNTDQMIQQLASFAQEIGDDLTRRFYWRNLDIEANVTGDGSSTNFVLPPDFGPVSPGFTVVSSKYQLVPLRGPVTNEVMMQAKNSYSAPVWPIWRFIGGAMEFYPAPSSGEILKFNYYSRNWVLDLDGVTRKPAWTADTDTPLVDDYVIRLGVMWRWQQAKGLDYAENFRLYEAAIDQSTEIDNTPRVINMSRTPVVGDQAWPANLPVWP